MEHALTYRGSDCLIWPYSTINGYARRTIDGKTHVLSKLLCEDVHGPAPEGKPQAQHTCGVKACINPAHLKWGDQPDNEQDKRTQGTYYTGCRAPEYHARLVRDPATGRFTSQARPA
jgi:hypothetical protein